MRSLLRRSFRRAAVAATVATLLAQSGALASQPMNAADALNLAGELLRDGKAVRAKHALVRIDRAALSAPDRERLSELLSAADRRLRHADPVDVSLEKAEIAIAEGDVRSAERHAIAARDHAQATAGQQRSAESILDSATTLRAELQPLAIAALLQAENDFLDSRYPEAKAGFDAVYRSGARLSDEQLRSLERHRTRIYELERERGGVFEVDYTPLGMLQPGRVERTDDPRPTREEPADSGAQVSWASAEPQDAAAQDSQPQAEPAQAAPAPGDDLFQQALRFDAQRYLAEADAAFAEGRFNEAEQKYALVAGAYRQYVSGDEASRADTRLAEARALLQGRSGTLLEGFSGTRDLVRQQAVAEYDNYMEQARAALSQGDFERARALAGSARIAVAERREVFSEAEYNQRAGAVDNLLQQVRNSEEGARVSEIERQSREVAVQTRDAAARQRADRDRKIIEALDRIRDLQMEQKYEEALQVVDQVLFLDPNNPAGLLLKDVLRDVVICREFDKIQRDKGLSFGHEFNEIQRGMIIPREIMSYPSDWPELSFRRGEPIAYVDSEEDRRVLADLEGRRIPASFAANTLEDVLNFIGTVTNLNMDVDWQAMGDIGIERDAEVTLNLRPVPVKVVLDRVLEKVSPDRFSRASWAVEDGVLVVSSQENLRRKTFIKIYDVRDLVFQVPDFPEVPELDLDTVLQQSSQRGGRGGGGGIFQDPEDISVEQILQDERDTLDRLIEIVQTNVDFDGWETNGGDTGFIQELNGNLIITNTAANHRSIVGLLSQLREVRAIQISVESRFLTVAQDFFEKIGFDLDIYFNAKNNQYEQSLRQERFFGGTGSNNFGPTSPGQTSTRPSDVVAGGAVRNPGGSGATATTQHWIQSVDEQTGEITYQFAPLPTSVVAPDNLSIIPVQSGSDALAEGLIGTGFAQSVLALNPALGVAATFLDDIQVDLLIEATQADRRNVTLTAPRLTFFNGKFANIFVATQQSFVSDLTPIVGTGSVAFDPTVSPLTTGVTLLLRGVVSADRRYVTLMVNSRVASLVSLDNETEVEAATGGGGEAVGGTTATGTIQLPIISISSIATGVTVPDKGTILLGGQRFVTESEVEVGVPVLSKLPLLNRFFVNRIESKEEQTLLILLKPTIIIQNEEEERNFPGLLDSLGGGLGAGM
ncbi:MAG: hypothetical protein IBJ10_04365 [Phycisphaerales bacterium]|nr:hypothetical protein [Phycisphaerales bacterium]